MVVTTDWHDLKMVNYTKEEVREKFGIDPDLAGIIWIPNHSPGATSVLGAPGFQFGPMLTQVRMTNVTQAASLLMEHPHYTQYELNKALYDWWFTYQGETNSRPVEQIRTQSAMLPVIALGMMTFARQIVGYVMKETAAQS